MANHSSILAWKIPWTEERGGLQSMGSQESDTTEWLNHHKVINLINRVKGKNYMIIPIEKCIWQNYPIYDSYF